MPAAVKSLYREFSSNSYTVYPIGFYKKVKLNDKKQEEMAEVLAALTGISKDELMQLVGDWEYALSFEPGCMFQVNSDLTENLVRNEDGSYQIIVSDSQKDGQNDDQKDLKDKQKDEQKSVKGTENSIFNNMSENTSSNMLGKISVIEAITYDEFLGFMDKADRIIVALGMKDKTARMHELIYTRKASSAKIVFTRYLAMISTMLLPVLLIALWLTVLVAEYYGDMSTRNNIDMLAFAKYTFGWLLPTLMVSTAVGVILTELIDSPIAIMVQGLWWFFGLFAGMRMMEGGYGWNLVPRHNILGNTRVYLDNFNILMINRIVYAVLAMTMVSATILIYEAKRKGRFHTYDRNTRNAFVFIRKIFVNRGKISKA